MRPFVSPEGVDGFSWAAGPWLRRGMVGGAPREASVKERSGLHAPRPPWIGVLENTWSGSMYVDAIIQSFVCLARARGMETSRVHTQVERRPAA